VFFTQSGTPSDVSEETVVGGTSMIPSIIKNSTPEINSDSVIVPSAHQPAVFFTQSGTSA